MLLSIALLLALSSTSALPTARFTSVLGTKDTTFQYLPVGRTAISRHDMSEIGRLASAVNLAYCSNAHHLEPFGILGPSSPAGPAQLGMQPGQYRRRSASVAGSRSHVIVSSLDPEFEQFGQQVDMSWYISHTPSTQTLTLAFSSLSSVDDTLELLAALPSDLNSTVEEFLVPLPYWLFPPEVQPQPDLPRMHHSLLRPLETHGAAALEALLDLIETPPAAAATGREIFRDMLRRSLGKLASSSSSLLSSWPSWPSSAGTDMDSAGGEVPRIKTVEIVGHGLGAAVGLVAAVALHLEVTGPAAQSYSVPLSPVSIRTALFGLPRVGDRALAAWIDTLVLSDPEALQVNRITSFADTIPHLPERHLGLAHPSVGEIWIGADPRVAYACRSAEVGQESHQCSSGLAVEQTSLLDHAGPFGGVWIGRGSCQSARQRGVR